MRKKQQWKMVLKHEKKSENGVEKEEVPEMGDENKENDFIGDGFVVPPFLKNKKYS